MSSGRIVGESERQAESSEDVWATEAGERRDAVVGDGEDDHAVPS